MSDYSNNTKRVLFIESGQAGGGSFGSLFTLVAGIDRESIEPTVLFVNRTRWVDKFEKLGVRVLVISDLRYSNDGRSIKRVVVNRIIRKIDSYFPSLYLFVVHVAHFHTIRRVKEVIRWFQIDMVYLNNQPNRDLFGVIAAKESGSLIVSHIRSLRTDNFDARRARFVNATVSLFICASTCARNHWVDRGVSQDKSVVIYNGVDIEKLEGHRGRNPSGDRPSFRLGAVGMLTEVKGHMRLLDVWERVIAMHPDIILEIVGEGIERKALEAAIRLKKLKNVRLLGYRSDAVSLIASFDALVQPSISENCSRVILEAFALGTPVVASRVGGNPELVIDGSSGLLFDLKEEKSLISALSRIVTDQELRETLSQNGMRLVRQKFSAQSYVKRVQENLIRCFS
jgi:glycosyltransferase involved in cell wall biosynthesis